MTRTALRARALIAFAAGAGLIAAAAMAAAPASATTSSTTPATAPSITAPTSGGAGATVPFSGDDWPAYSSVNVYLLGSNQTFVCAIHADSAGTVAAQTCALPTFLIAGHYTVHGDDGHGNTANAAGQLALTPSTTLTSTFNNGPTYHVAAGSTVSLGGHGFAPSSLITVKVGSTIVTTTPAAPTTDTNGTFSGVVFTIPTGQAAGQVSVQTTDASANSVTGALQVYRAKITAKNTGAAGQSLLVAGSGYPADDTVNLYLSRSGSNTFICSTHTDDSGTILSQSCLLPTFLPQGAATLIATDNAVTVSLPFTLQPTLIADSTFNSQPTPAVNAGGTLSLAGHGYTASSSLVVTIGSKVLASVPASPTTDTNGTFSSVVVTIPANQAVGSATITVKDGAGHSASVKLYVFKAKVSAPAAGPAGVSQLIGGGGWPPADSLSVYLQNTVGSRTFMCTVPSDANGTITPTSCLVPNFLPGGTYSLVMSDGLVTASAPFTMQAAISATNGSGQPLAGGAVGTAVNLAGHGFTATSTISAKLGTKALNLVPGTPVTDVNGSFGSVSFAVPNVAAGTYSLTVTDAAGKKASVQFTVS